MSDDVLFVAVGSAGTLFGLWRIVAGRLDPTIGGRVLGVVAAGLTGALVLGGFGSVADGGGFLDHRADLAAGALLFAVMAMPLWGLCDERILARVSEIGIASIGLVSAYRLADHSEPSVGLVIAVASVVVAFLVAQAPGGGPRRLIGYGWFLIGTLVLAVTAADGALAPLADEIVEVHPGPVFAAFAALMWLAFHGVFAAKFVLIAFTCHRRRGRHLAYAFSERVIAPTVTSAATASVVLGIEAALLASDHLLDWADDTLVIATLIFAMPAVEHAVTARARPG